MNMWLPQFAIFMWSLYALTLDSEAITCPKGQRVEDKKRGICTSCTGDYFQPEENTSLVCRPCKKCYKEKGSEEMEKCNSVRDRECKCRENFVPHNSDSSVCRCASGFTRQSGDCVKVETTTSIPVSFPTVLTSPRPQERVPTQKPAHSTTTATITITPNTKKTTTTTTTTGQLEVTATTEEKKRVSQGSSIVVGLICLMVLLLALTALLCRQNVLSRVKRETEQTREASFRVPVEESGDGSQDPLKQNQEEP